MIRIDFPDISYNDLSGPYIYHDPNDNKYNKEGNFAGGRWYQNDPMQYIVINDGLVSINKLDDESASIIFSLVTVEEDTIIGTYSGLIRDF